MDAAAHGKLPVRMRPWHCLVCCAALCACDGVSAGEPPTRCDADLPQGHLMADRSGTIAALERMPESCLKALVKECSAAANRQFMDLGSAAMCSMSYEAILRKSFGGSFHAFMEWWRHEQAASSR